MSKLPLRFAFAGTGLVAILASFFAFAAGSGAPERTLPYVGRLDLNGSPVTGGVKFTFHIWDDATAGTELHSQTISDVGVVGGQFAVVLNAAIPDSVYNAQTLFVAIDVGPCSSPGNCATPTPLAGRQALHAVPQAVRAAQAYNFTVQQQLAVTGNATVNNLVLGDVVGVAGYRGMAAAGRNNVNDYALIQDMAGTETLLNVKAGGHINLRVNNTTHLNVDGNGTTADNLLVTGSLVSPGYQTSCMNGSNQTPAHCCRINVQDGSVVCKVAQDGNGNVWNAGPTPPPFGAAPLGHYSLTCFEGISGTVFPTCCRTSNTGSVVCVAAMNWALTLWNTPGAVF